MANNKKQPPPKNFEEAVKELEQIIGEIERGEVGLEESLLKYERGNFLIQYCQSVLDSAEKQIQLVTRAPNGTAEIQPLELDRPEEEPQQ